MFDDRPLKRTLSGLALEYRIIQIYSRDAGKREAKISFNVGQGTQDLGFRSDVDILFDCEPAVPVVARRPRRRRPARRWPRSSSATGRAASIRRPAAGWPPTSSSTPRSTARAARPCCCRRAPTRSSTPAGPEYLIADADDHRARRRRRIASRSSSKRWIHLAKMNWFSGDHHVHAAGCAHYESPTEGVTPEDMMRHILGEDLNVGCVLSWGPCWYAQKQFFEGKVHPLSTPDYLMRYDVEVSGFPSSHAGHLCLLRLKEDDYPGTTRIEEWPSWDLPVLKWGKSQGGVVGFSHSRLGPEDARPTRCRPTRSRRSTASAPTSTSSTSSTTRSTSSRRSTRRPSGS